MILWKLQNQHDVKLTAASQEAVEQYNKAVKEYLRNGCGTLSLLEEALGMDPDLLMAHSAKGYFQAFTTRWGIASGMHASLKKAEKSLVAKGGTISEKFHVEALRALSRGNLIETVRIWDEILLLQPRDVLALRLAHSFYFILGDQRNLRDISLGGHINNYNLLLLNLY